MSRYTLILLFALTGCGGLYAPNPNLPPAHLLKSCPGPIWQASGTNADLARLLQEYQMALDLCDGDKEALRDWAESGTGD